MKFTVKIISLILAGALAASLFSASAGAEVLQKRVYRGFVYTGFMPEDDTSGDKSNYQLTITGYRGKAESISIPAQIGGQRVTGIDLNNKTVKSIEISNSVTRVDISGLSNLKKITVSKTNGNFSVKNNLLLNKKGTRLIAAPCGLKRVRIPDSVKTIGHRAFSNSRVKTAVFGRNVTYMGTYAFKNCKNLQTVKLNKRLRQISAGAFEGCKRIKNITLPKSVRKVGAAAFGGCKAIVTVKNGSCAFEKSASPSLRCFSKKTKIIAGRNSSAAKYAKKYNLKFKGI